MPIAIATGGNRAQVEKSLRAVDMLEGEEGVVSWVLHCLSSRRCGLGAWLGKQWPKRASGQGWQGTPVSAEVHLDPSTPAAHLQASLMPL